MYIHFKSVFTAPEDEGQIVARQALRFQLFSTLISKECIKYVYYAFGCSGSAWSLIFNHSTP